MGHDPIEVQNMHGPTLFTDRIRHSLTVNAGYVPPYCFPEGSSGVVRSNAVCAVMLSAAGMTSLAAFVRPVSPSTLFILNICNTKRRHCQEKPKNNRHGGRILWYTLNRQKGEICMTFDEAARERHSIRAYETRAIEPEKIEQLEENIARYNAQSGLSIQLVTDEPKAFSGRMAKYGRFSGVSNYIVLIGKKGADLDEKVGYYGEKLVMDAQMMGLNTCWVGLTYKKIAGTYEVKKGEKLVLVIAIGYGAEQGRAHKSKSAEDVSGADEPAPEWFRKGVEGALLAPTAVNQQKFMITLKDGKLSAKAGRGFFSKVDLGIVKYHFEMAAGKDHTIWE